MHALILASLLLYPATLCNARVVDVFDTRYGPLLTACIRCIPRCQVLKMALATLLPLRAFAGVAVRGNLGCPPAHALTARATCFRHLSTTIC
jgi:hypothetical protein